MFEKKARLTGQQLFGRRYRDIVGLWHESHDRVRKIARRRAKSSRLAGDFAHPTSSMAAASPRPSAGEGT
jgi:hypothetical protein